MHCARLNLPTSECTHYFVQGLKQEIREYVIIQQPENYDIAERDCFGEFRSASSIRPETNVSQIVAELSRVIAPVTEIIGVISRQQTDFHDAHLRAILQESEAKLEMKIFKPASIFVWR